MSRQIRAILFAAVGAVGMVAGGALLTGGIASGDNGSLAIGAACLLAGAVAADQALITNAGLVAVGFAILAHLALVLGYGGQREFGAERMALVIAAALSVLAWRRYRYRPESPAPEWQ
jgi:hypothetical protein